MKKSLLLLSLLVSTNIFCVKATRRAEQKNMIDSVESVVEETNQAPEHNGPHRPAHETTERYLDVCGGDVPMVPANQPAECKHLHRAVAKKSTTKTTTRQTRGAKRRAAKQAARTTTAPVTAARTVVR